MLKLSNLKLRFILITVFVTAAVAIGIYLPSHISVTITPSLNHRVFYITREVANVLTDDYVLFNFSSPMIEGGKTVKGMKRVGCGEGEYLKEMMGDYYCGNQYLGRAKDRSQKGEQLPRFEYSGVVPQGKYFVVGDSNDSFDSRYWGFLDRGKIIAKAYPIW